MKISTFIMRTFEMPSFCNWSGSVPSIWRPRTWRASPWLNRNTVNRCFLALRQRIARSCEQARRGGARRRLMNPTLGRDASRASAAGVPAGKPSCSGSSSVRARCTRKSAGCEHAHAASHLPRQSRLPKQ